MTYLDLPVAPSLPATSQVVDLVVVLILFLLPEGKVFLEKLDDALGVTEVILLELINLVEGLLEGVVGELASFLVILEHLIVEHGEVQSETELNGIAGGKIDAVCSLVSILGLCLHGFEKISLGVLGDVAVVVTDHFDEEGFGLSTALFVEDLAVDHVDDLLAVFLKLLFDG